MSGYQGSERRAMPAAVFVRLPGTLAARVSGAAEASDLSSAAYLRRLAVDATASAPALVRPSPPRRPVPPPPPEAVREVARLREVLGELHGTLRQVAGLKRQAGATPAELSRIDDLLARIDHAALGLDGVKGALMGGGR